MDCDRLLLLSSLLFSSLLFSFFFFFVVFVFCFWFIRSITNVIVIYLLCLGRNYHTIVTFKGRPRSYNSTGQTRGHSKSELPTPRSEPKIRKGPQR